MATCNPFGAKKWLDEFSPALSARSVVVIPDNDTPGIEHANIVARSVRADAGSVKLLAPLTYSSAPFGAVPAIPPDSPPPPSDVRSVHWALTERRLSNAPRTTCGHVDSFLDDLRAAGYAQPA